MLNWFDVQALENCVDEGLIKGFGLSDFNSQQIQEILDKGRIKPAILQVSGHFIVDSAVILKSLYILVF